MDNLTANAQGVADVNIHLAGVTLGGGAANDIAGRAVIVHAAPDDYTSQPSGHAGARVACGVINAAMWRQEGRGSGLSRGHLTSPLSAAWRKCSRTWHLTPGLPLAQPATSEPTT